MRRLLRLALTGGALGAIAGGLARAAVPEAGTPVLVAGRRLQVLDTGEGPAVVLVHGLGGGLLNFARLIPHLAGRRVIAMDRPGAGRSDPAAPGEAGLAAQAATLAALLDLLGTGPAVIVGHSLGGAVALQLALDRPDLAAAVVTLGALTRPQHMALAAPFASLAGTPPLRETVTTLGAPLLTALAGPASLALSFLPETPEAAFLTEGGALLSLQPRALSGILRDLEVVTDGIGRLQERLPHLAPPLTILHGAQDKVLPVADGIHLAGLVPGARLLTPDGGHMLPWTQPGLVSQAILRA